MNRSLAALALVAGSAALASAQANFIYGLSQAATNGKVELVHVNTATGDQTNFADLGNISGDVNGLASILGTGKFHFTAGSRFYSYDHYAAPGSRLVQFTGTLGASPSNGAYYQGSYYYINGNQLRKVTATGANTFSETIRHTFASAFGTFGDITFDHTSTSAGTGTMYISTSGGANGGISKFNLNTNTFSMIASGVQQMQLGFAQDNNLYGVFSGGNTATVEQSYRINLTTGARTTLPAFSNGASVYIRDAATAPTPPVPEPASMAVLGLGLAALKRRRAKK